MRYHKIPNETIRRLPTYLRALMALTRKGQSSVSSSELAEAANVNAWQIRKDFSYFGELGRRGVGYDVAQLAGEIRKILRLNVVNKIALVGAGNLGNALLAYPGFEMYGFRVAAAFDASPGKIGAKIAGIEIEDVSRVGTLAKRGISVAIIAVPAAAAQGIADQLILAGVTGILNFSPIHLVVPKKVKVITIDIAMDLARLPYYMPAAENRGQKTEDRVQDLAAQLSGEY